jgi:hypothetical protein
LAREGNKRRAIGVGVAGALFVFLSWGNDDIAAAFNRVSAGLAILLLPLYGYRWRRSVTVAVRRTSTSRARDAPQDRGHAARGS